MSTDILSRRMSSTLMLLGRMMDAQGCDPAQITRLLADARRELECRRIAYTPSADATNYGGARAEMELSEAMAG